MLAAGTMDTVESRNTYKFGAVAFTPNRTKLNAESYQFLKVGAVYFIVYFLSFCAYFYFFSCVPKG